MSRTNIRLLALGATMSIMVAASGCQSAKEAPTTFVREDAPGETMTLLPTHSVKWKLASFVHDVPHFGIFELKSAQSIVSGTYTYGSNEKEPRYTFEAEGGKKWTATLSDGVLKDEQGNTWLRQRESAAIPLKHDK